MNDYTNANKQASKFRVPGKPVGKERPRYSKFTGGFYTPTKTKDFERLVGFYAKQCMMKSGKKLTSLAVGVNLTIFHKVPSSYAKQRKSDALENIQRPIKTPDTDNVLKCVMDGMESVVYENDNQVVENVIKRFYSSDWGIEVEFYEI